MAYLIYSLALLTIISGTRTSSLPSPSRHTNIPSPLVLFLTRQTWLPAFSNTFSDLLDRLPTFSTLQRYSPLPNSFREDVEAGLHSTNFDMTGNIEGGDSRSGLDDKSKAEVLRIMRRKRLNFDEARRVWLEERMRKQGIGADGLPRDPKLVTFG
jgi:Fungal protein of unknown function (DUF2015)